MLTTDSYKGTNKKRTVQQLVRKNFWLQLSNSRRERVRQIKEKAIRRLKGQRSRLLRAYLGQ